jgi:Holliday junction resolvase-like predicted endonuclease
VLVVSEGSGGRTDQQEAGDAAESLVAERLAARGWSILARNVHFGRSELDIVATDPGPPARLVVVEVRWRRSREFGGA